MRQTLQKNYCRTSMPIRRDRIYASMLRGLQSMRGNESANQDNEGAAER
jgi:hypothetical protein